MRKALRTLSEQAHAAHRRIREFLPFTPFERLSDGLFLKREDRQPTGSFKARGVFSAVTALSPDHRARGIVAASTGNHGLATAYAMRTLGLGGRLFVPRTASPLKVARIEQTLEGLPDARLERAGRTCDDAELAARRYVRETGLHYVSPYNDLDVVAGQATAGLEIVEQANGPLDAVFVSVGGGGLIAGIGCVLKTLSPGTRVIAASPENDCAMYHSLREGRIVTIDAKPTLSDGTAGGVEAGSVTFPLCQDVIDDFVLVPENEIERALETLSTRGVHAEGAAGVAWAAFERYAESAAPETRCAVVICGGNR